MRYVLRKSYVSNFYLRNWLKKETEKVELQSLFKFISIRMQQGMFIKIKTFAWCKKTNIYAKIFFFLSLHHCVKKKTKYFYRFFYYFSHLWFVQKKL